MAGTKIIGNVAQLLAYHGFVDFTQAISTITQSTEITVIDVLEINKASEKGGLFVSHNGKIFDKFDEEAEAEAKYKLVPTGLIHKYSNRPLFASFLKSKKTWQGVYIGTAEKLFEMYAKAYNPPENVASFDRSYLDIFCNENADRDLVGFGLTEILNYYENTVSTDVTNDVAEEVNDSEYEKYKKAVDKIQKQLNSGKKSKSEKAKLQTKLKNMTKLMEKAREAENIPAETDAMEVEETKKIASVAKVEIENVQADANGTIDVVKSNKKVNNVVTDATATNHADDSNVSTAVEDKPEVMKETKSEKKETTSENKKAVVKNDVVDKQIEDTAVTEKNMNVNSVDKQIKNETVVEVSNNTTVNEKNIEVKSTSYTNSNDKHDELFEINPEVTDAERKNLHQIAVDIYNKLLYKENWADRNYDRLCFYLKGIMQFISTRSAKNNTARGDGYLFSTENVTDNKRKLLFNTNLIDVYGNFIYIIDHTPKTEVFYKKRLTLMQSKSGLIEEGFQLSDIRHLPGTVKFLSDNRGYVFSGTIEDFDLEDDEHLNHIINERRTRFPENYKDVSCKIICDKLKNSIEQAIKISEIDYRYIMPMYNIKMDEVEFLIPFHLDTHYGERPELAIIITNKRGLWKIFTVLKAEDAYDNARLVFNPNNTWMNAE